MKNKRQTNTGRTHFRKGLIPWNKGKTVNKTPKMLAFYKRAKGSPRKKPKNFSETMRAINPPLGKKKKFSSRDKDKKLRVWRDGYIMLYKPEHPSSRKIPPDYGYILEHRMVMEAFIGRKLLPTEIIHHIDGKKSNNDIDNLLLCSSNREHILVHSAMEVFLEKLIREGKAYYDKEKKEFCLR